MAEVENIAKDNKIDEDMEEIEDEDDLDTSDEEEEEEEEDFDSIMGQENSSVGRRSGRGLTLKTLLKERILEPGDGTMTINYLGNKFKGDLLSDGQIRSQETGKIFGTPSAWAIFCKKIVNPDKKSGCGWASVRYKGKKLDAYKNNWFRQKRIEYEKEEEVAMGSSDIQSSSCEVEPQSLKLMVEPERVEAPGSFKKQTQFSEEEDSSCESEMDHANEQEIIEYSQLGKRTSINDKSTMVELSTFQSLGRIQPFNVTMSSSAMAVIDLHGHVTLSEVVGYLGGQWDVNNHNLIVSHAFPLKSKLNDTKNGTVVEKEIMSEMSQLKLSLVGWYHTHPSLPPFPSLRDIDNQLDYEMKMKGYNDASYTPVLGIIVSPYQKHPIHTKGLPHMNGNATGFWVMPPPENKPTEYSRPMSMQFTIVQDAFIPKEALMHMSETIKYYKDFPEAVTWTDEFEDSVSYWNKLLISLKSRVPKDHFRPLMDFLRNIIDLKLASDDHILCHIHPASDSEKSELEIKLREDIDDERKYEGTPLKIEFSKPKPVDKSPRSYSPFFHHPPPPLFAEKKDDHKEDDKDSSLASHYSGFLDLSATSSVLNPREDKHKSQSIGIDWLAHQKYAQEHFNLSEIRKDLPIPELPLHPSDLPSQWNPGLNLGKNPSTVDMPKNLTINPFLTDSPILKEPEVLISKAHSHDLSDEPLDFHKS